jgi:hypothetical protein
MEGLSPSANWDGEWRRRSFARSGRKCSNFAIELNQHPTGKIHFDETKYQTEVIQPGTAFTAGSSTSTKWNLFYKETVVRFIISIFRRMI